MRQCRATAGRPATHNEEIGTGHRGGDATLTVTNRNQEDGYLKIRDTNGQLLRKVYVEAGQTSEITQIPAGTYMVAYAIGNEFTRAADTFCDLRGAKLFEEPFRFQTTGGWELTLNTIYGNAETEIMDPADFADF